MLLSGQEPHFVVGHTYVNAPPYNYAIVAPLCKPKDGGGDSWFTQKTARKWDNSCDPGGDTPTCVSCLPKPGVTDVKKCLRDAFDRYNSPTVHKALGPNSNTLSVTLARACCAGVGNDPPFPGNYPGWGDPPAPSRLADCPPGPLDCR